jgi:hypothetical protein
MASMCNVTLTSSIFLAATKVKRFANSLMLSRQGIEQYVWSLRTNLFRGAAGLALRLDMLEHAWHEPASHDRMILVPLAPARHE